MGKISKTPYDNLYKATAEYIKARGGYALVIGGVEVQEWPGDNAHVYRLAIKFTGKPPQLEKDKS